MTLGTLSAGLAHELNNPAAAATRAVDGLEATLRYVTKSLRALAAHGITAEAYESLDALRLEAVPQPVVADALAVAEREEALSDWLVRPRRRAGLAVRAHPGVGLLRDRVV